MRNWRHDRSQRKDEVNMSLFAFSEVGIVLRWMNLVWIECNMYCLLKTLSRGKARLFLLYFNSSRKVFNLKQIAFREDRSRQPIVNTQCNFHSRFYICSLCNHFLIKCEILKCVTHFAVLLGSYLFSYIQHLGNCQC